ncbi:hypothetical protein CHS0354_019834 [Potamilus streckersoni]|nr:hypothetical protein CHS0354_019834 [Potamilus streckersoni]
MSKEMYHSIFYQSDGGALAHEIKDFFARRKYNIRFNLHKLQDADTRKASFSGVTILLITPESHDFIQSGKDSDLNKLFPNPDFTVALLFHVGKSRDEISKILASRVKNSHRWTLLEFRSGTGLSTLGIHIMQIVEKVECDSLPSSSVRQFQVWKPEGIKPRQHVILILDKPVDEDTEVKVLQEWDGAKQEAQQLNSMTYSFIIGDAKPGKNNIEVFVNNVSYGKAMLHVNYVEPEKEQISTLLHSVINPVELLCQCLHIVPENRQDLDMELVDLLSKDKNSVSNIFYQRFGDSHSKSVLPTLLHFGAKYGMTQFCLQLIKLPGSHHSLRMKNKDGLLPYDMARNGGFDDLAAFLQKTEEEEGIQITSNPQFSLEDIDSDDTFPSSTNHEWKKHVTRYGLEQRLLLNYERPQISPDYSANSRRMTDVTGNVGCRPNLRRNQSLPPMGNIKRKEHPYDLPSDTP